jgi:hypothetical protein
MRSRLGSRSLFSTSMIYYPIPYPFWVGNFKPVYPRVRLTAVQ